MPGRKKSGVSSTGGLATELGELPGTPSALQESLAQILDRRVRLSVMIWGPPGVGKSSIVAAVAARHDLRLVDLRLSQLAPTDLRGLPVAENGRARWFVPEFLPSDGHGVLFLDEINMAPPVMQGIAQQLILDRRVGSYSLPEGWFVWAAGNRAEDRASVYDMPPPLANRFIHFEVGPNFDCFRRHALSSGINEAIIAFLAFRPALLHQPDDSRPAWPSPRSWFMASHLLAADMDISPAVGAPAAEEFNAYRRLYQSMPDLDAICAGDLAAGFPSEPSARHAVSVGLVIRAKGDQAKFNAMRWLATKAPNEWQASFFVELIRLAREEGTAGALAKLIQGDAALRDTLRRFREIILQ